MHAYYTYGNHIYTFSSMPLMHSLIERHFARNYISVCMYVCVYMWPGRCWMCLVGSLKSWFIPTALFCSKQRWSLPFQFWVWGTQGDEAPGYYTSNSKVLNKGIQDHLGCIWLVGTNNEHFTVCFIFLFLERHQMRQDKESAAFPSWKQT